jgi:superoxide dismutase, Cu-Zn family
MSIKNILSGLMGIAIYFITSLACATILIPMYLTNDQGIGKKIGTVKADDTIYGLLLTPNLKGLPAGVHGFHIHELPLCGNSGTAAGGHLDPRKTNHHSGPYSGDGHLGDLPVLIVNEDGSATLPVLAPRLKLAQIEGHSLMIHSGGDNYADKPEKMGGGCARIACGVIGDAH